MQNGTVCEGDKQCSSGKCTIIVDEGFSGTSYSMKGHILYAGIVAIAIIAVVAAVIGRKRTLHEAKKG